MPRVTSACEQCGKPMTYYTGSYPGGHKRWCSRACQKAATRIDTTCPQCGKAFWYHRSWPRKYCSRQCSAAVNAKANLGIVELPPQTCEVCGKPIDGPTWRGRRFCSRACFGKHLAISLSGIARPEVAGERPDLQRRISKVCPECRKPFRVSVVHSTKRVHCSKACYTAYQRRTADQMSGPNNRNWRGGPLPYYGPNWRQARRNARLRDRYTCQRCGVTEAMLGKQLDVHHIEPFRNFGVERYQEANGTANLISLCPSCHLSIER